MPKPFKKPSYTALPDELFDTLMAELSGAEFKVLCYIARRTLGWRKNSDSISLDQICNGITTRGGRVVDRGTGLSREGAIQALAVLSDGRTITNKKTGEKEVTKGRGLLIVEERFLEGTRHNLPTVYRLNIEGDEPEEIVRKSDHIESENLTMIVRKSDHPMVRKSDTQQTVLQQTVEQEENPIVPFSESNTENLWGETEPEESEQTPISEGTIKTIVSRLKNARMKVSASGRRQIGDTLAELEVSEEFVLATLDGFLEKPDASKIRYPAGYFVKILKTEVADSQGNGRRAIPRPASEPTPRQPTTDTPRFDGKPENGLPDEVVVWNEIVTSSPKVQDWDNSLDGPDLIRCRKSAKFTAANWRVVCEKAQERIAHDNPDWLNLRFLLSGDKWWKCFTNRYKFQDFESKGEKNGKRKDKAWLTDLISANAERNRREAAERAKGGDS